MTNQRLRQLKARIGKLRDWLKEEAANTETPTLADYIQSILSRKAQTWKSDVSQSFYNLKDEVKESEQIRKSVYSILAAGTAAQATPQGAGHKTLTEKAAG